MTKRTRLEAPCRRCDGVAVQTNGPSFKCEKCRKKMYFSLRTKLRNGETIEIIKLPRGGTRALRILIEKTPEATIQTIRSGLVPLRDLDPAQLPTD